MKIPSLLLNLITCSCIYSQTHSFPFPDHCDFIYKHETGLLFLSSTEGLFTHNGSALEEVALEGLDEVNIQSSFFPEGNKAIWTSNYKRLVRVDLSDYSIKTIPIISKNGDTLNGDYHLFYLDEANSMLYAKAGDEVYSIHSTGSSSEFLASDFFGRRIYVNHTSDDTLYLCSYYYTDTPAILKIPKKGGSKTIQSLWLDWPEGVYVKDLIGLENQSVLMVTDGGLYHGDITSRRITKVSLPDLQKAKLICIGVFDARNLIVSATNGYFLLDKNYLLSHPVIKPFILQGLPDKADKIIQQMDGTIFFSKYNDAIYSFNPAKIKFQNVPVNKLQTLSYVNKFSGLNEWLSGRNDNCLFKQNDSLQILSCDTRKKSSISKGKIQRLIPHPQDTNLYRFFTDHQNNIYGGFLNGRIYRYASNGLQEVFTPYAQHKNFNFFFGISNTYHLASVNNELLMIWNPQDTNTLLKKLNFAGDISNAIYIPENNHIALASTQGLTLLDLKSNVPIVNKLKEGVSCYCVLNDGSGNLWYSSAFGIHNYNYESNLTKSYNYADGVSHEKYLTGECLKISGDSLLFFHESGATLVIPSTLKELTNNSEVLINNFKVNDHVYNKPQLLNYEDIFETAYINNTISFEIINVDWSDPTKTLFRYKLDGLDNDWIIVDDAGQTIRYPRLPPGHYTLLVQGANADGIWNESQKEIDIIVRPPFWMTWWFISLAALSSIAIIYWLLRSYYQRKLEKKNIALREQAQIIKHQQELEHERTRIASEMHDDLGSGLTTIRYLSDKALLHAKNPAETEQIKRIADHSNRLVRNMSEIIWAMNSRFDNTENLVGYLRRYASEFLSEHQMPLEFKSNEDSHPTYHVGGEKRRNIFLVFKEMLHNSVKYSGAAKIQIDVDSGDDMIITIKEMGGKGFNPDDALESGNGLYNARKRMETIGGKIGYEKSDDAMQISISVPLEKPSHA